MDSSRAVTDLEYKISVPTELIGYFFIQRTLPLTKYVGYVEICKDTHRKVINISLVLLDSNCQKISYTHSIGIEEYRIVRKFPKLFRHTLILLEDSIIKYTTEHQISLYPVCEEETCQVKL